MKEPAVLKGMESIQREIEKDPMVGKTVSLADYIKRINMAMNGDSKEFDKIPDDKNLIAQYLFLYSTSGEPGDFDTVVDNGYKNASVTIFLKTDSSAFTDAFVQKVRRLGADRLGPYATMRIGGGASSGTALNEVLVHEKMLNIAQIMAVVFIISSLVFRSALAGGLVLVPLVVSVAANFAVMGFFGIPMEIATSTISAMAVGLGADYAIYLAFRMREELRKGGDEKLAVMRAFSTAGKADLLVAASVGAGYFILVFSYGFNIHFWLGLLISIAMVTSAFASITIFPALILALRPKFIFEGNGSKEDDDATEPSAAAAVLAIIAGLALTASTAGARELSAVEIMKANFSVQKVADSESDATFRLVTQTGEERIRKTHGVAKLIKGTTDNMQLVRFVAPPDIKGTTTLSIEHSDKDDDIWIYLPALKKTRRLVSSNKKDSFVGTDFSYGDVIGHRVEDWNHKLLRSETVDGADCYVLESTPARPSVGEDSGYSKRVGWIRKDDFVAIKGEMYGEDGTLLKQFFAGDIKETDAANKKFQAMRIESRNVQTGHKTVITFENFRAKVGIKDEMFTARYLEKDF